MGTDDNYLDIPTSKRDTYVYRIIKTTHLFEFLKKGENVLVKPELWDDPFENFILKSHFIRDGEPVAIGPRDQFYGQCWTLQQASDAMWRIYSPRFNAVRIRTSVRKLAVGMRKWRGSWAAKESFVGKVRYLKDAELVAFGRSVLQGKQGPLTNENLARTLLVKRPAFRHEREIRLLFTPHDFHHFKEPIVRYPADANVLVDQIMLDPRMDEARAEVLKRKIQDAGFSGSVKRSLLYAPPPDLQIPWSVTR